LNTFVVNYFYTADESSLAELRPIHRSWMAGPHEDALLLASGPLIDNPGAMLIFKAQSAEQLSALLDNDPFDIAGFIGERVITQWNPVMGSWVS
jgi:uncharacterized protein YciI